MGSGGAKGSHYLSKGTLNTSGKVDGWRWRGRHQVFDPGTGRCDGWCGSRAR